MKHCRTVKLLFGVSLALLSGCASVGPEPRLLADELQYAETVKNRYKADGNWWRQYNDPELNNLIETALANNPDYLKAAFNVEKELAGLGLATADRFLPFRASFPLLHSARSIPAMILPTVFPVIWG